MRNILRVSLTALSIFAFVSLAACNRDNPSTITIIASPTPHADILSGPVKAFVEANTPYSVEVREVDDYVTPNKNLNDDPSVFANYFQHEPYLLQFNRDNNTKVKSVFGVHYELFGIYAGRGGKDLNNIPDGAVIAVPNDVTNEARALNLLQDNGVLTLREGAGLKATKLDIVSNPHNVVIEEVEAAALSVQLLSTDFAVINGNYALQNDLGPALVYESATGAVGAEVSRTYTNVVAVKENQVNDPRVKALEDAFKDSSVQTFIQNTYQGSVAYNYLAADQIYTE